jgi:hypothetical protein
VGKVQDYATPWWVKCDAHPLCRGQLVYAFVPHVDLIPNTLVPEGRTAPTSHNEARYKIETVRVRDPQKKPGLPVAALPSFEGEVYTVHRSKVRPCIVVSVGGPEVPKELRPSTTPKWQSSPTTLVVPLYGTERSDQRAGWHPPFLDRIRRCEYPQFMLDTIPNAKAESVVRFDHVQPIGRHHDSYEPKEFRLSDDALLLVDEWVTWLHTGILGEETVLADIRQALMGEEAASPASGVKVTNDAVALSTK